MMENWGLITWKQSYYLPEKDNSCFEPKGRVLISAHEFAQQWFGNFVSPQWWSFLWLSEGMGALVAAITIDHVRNAYVSESTGLFMLKINNAIS